MSPLQKLVRLDPGDRDFKTYREVLEFCFEEMLKQMPVDINNWPDDNFHQIAVFVPVPGYERGIRVDVAVSKLQDRIPSTNLKA